MNEWLDTIGDLIDFLSRFNPDNKLRFAPLPDKNGWVHAALAVTAQPDDDENMIVLALKEETDGDERDMTFKNEEGKEVRPV